MSTSKDFKTIFKHSLICIFLSLRAKLKKKTLPSDTVDQFNVKKFHRNYQVACVQCLSRDLYEIDKAIGH